ncbi:uncharacterized protein LOC135392472 [Ornithodoros turicata]|uniref:uncharacterized protein LOC135392472 n=1 Tax=Ornithodoros turicata TaxID=34597 RepID=UPI003139F451
MVDAGHTGLALAAVVLLDVEQELRDCSGQQRKRRSVWMKPYLKRRPQMSCCENLMRELAMEVKDNYRRYIRMDVSTFEHLLNLVRPQIQRQDTNFREAISPEERLSVTLRLLATGESFHSLGFQFRMAHNTVAGIVLEVCRALYAVLKSQYLKVPTTEDEWKKVAMAFEDAWNFPNCIGALDGKHVQILPPSKSGAMYRNYKGSFSILLMARVGADLEFLYIDVGRNGRLSDSAVWNDSTLNNVIESNSLHIPSASVPRGSDTTVPYAIVADEGFGLKTYMQRPFSARELNVERRIYNCRLSRARRVVENAFGVLASGWQVYRSLMRVLAETAKDIVKATVVLHNVLQNGRSTKRLYTPPGYLDTEDILTGYNL